MCNPGFHAGYPACIYSSNQRRCRLASSALKVHVLQVKLNPVESFKFFKFKRPCAIECCLLHPGHGQCPLAVEQHCPTRTEALAAALDDETDQCDKAQLHSTSCGGIDNLENRMQKCQVLSRLSERAS